MNIWGFAKNHIVVYKTFKTHRPIQEICFTTDHMLMSFESRDSELLFMNPDSKELEMIHIDKSNEHSGKVNCMDTNLEANLFITGGKDGYVKVWTQEKQLIREI